MKKCTYISIISLLFVSFSSAAQKAKQEFFEGMIKYKTYMEGNDIYGDTVCDTLTLYIKGDSVRFDQCFAIFLDKHKDQFRKSIVLSDSLSYAVFDSSQELIQYFYGKDGVGSKSNISLNYLNKRELVEGYNCKVYSSTNPKTQVEWIKLWITDEYQFKNNTFQMLALKKYGLAVKKEWLLGRNQEAKLTFILDQIISQKLPSDIFKLPENYKFKKVNMPSVAISTD